MTHFPAPQSWQRIFLMLATTHLATVATAAELPLSVSAKSIAPAAVPAPTMPVAVGLPVNTPPEPSLPDAKLPQYQLGYRQRDRLTDHHRQTGVLHFHLRLPDRVLTVQVTLRIDGQPFATARQRQIDTVLANLRESTDSSSIAADTGAAVDATAQPGDDAVTAPQTDADEVAVAAEPAEASESSPAVARYTLATTPADLLHRYAATLGRSPTTTEARWLWTNWSDGPELLLLQPHFQAARAGERPLLDVLDLDHDGNLSKDELQFALTTLRQCDQDGNDIIDALEIQRVADRVNRRPSAHPVLTTWSEMLALRADDPQADNAPAADIQVLVEFDSQSPARSKLTLQNVAAAIDNANAAVTDDGKAIRLQIGAVPILFSLVQNRPSDQVSVGCVIDGYPLLPSVDPNDDGRLTIRELRQLDTRLIQFDRDGNGRLSASEMIAPVRVCVGLGPLVHRELAELRSSPVTTATVETTLPAWFAQMDRNGDLDLSRREFPGTAEQFTALDADGDELISVAESLTAQSNTTDSTPP